MTNVLVKILISKSWLFERTVAMRVQLINRKKKTNKRKKRISIHSESDPETELPMAQAQTRSPVCVLNSTSCYGHSPAMDSSQRGSFSETLGGRSQRECQQTAFQPMNWVIIQTVFMEM